MRERDLEGTKCIVYNLYGMYTIKLKWEVDNLETTNRIQDQTFDHWFMEVHIPCEMVNEGNAYRRIELTYVYYIYAVCTAICNW